MSKVNADAYMGDLVFNRYVHIQFRGNRIILS